MQPLRNILESAQERKLRGGFYTQENISDLIANWAIRNENDSILEPSFGNGNFLLSALNTLRRISNNSNTNTSNLCGVELYLSEVEIAKKRLLHENGNDGFSRNLIHDDFFSWYIVNRNQKFDCVIGNPPFIRYQNFPEPSRSLAMSIMESVGLRPNRLTNIWVPFVVASIELLNPNGRIGLVIPAELLQVSYASQLRRHLVDSFHNLIILTCNDILFNDAEQEIVILLADNKKANRKDSETDTIDFIDAIDYQSLASTFNEIQAKRNVSKNVRKYVNHDQEKWIKYFLEPHEIELMRDLRDSNTTTTLLMHGSVDVGVVTGRNDFFVLNKDTIDKYELWNFINQLIGRAYQLKGGILEQDDIEKMKNDGQKVFLLNTNNIKSEISGKLLEYIKFGEEQGYNKGYKCSIRKKWHAVPSIWSPNAFLYRQIHTFPKIVLNNTNATSTDTIHRLRIKQDKEAFLASYYTHLTAASSEIEGRSYGGGVLELEPREAEYLLMPKHLVCSMLSNEIDSYLRENELNRILEINDNEILIKEMGLSKRDCTILKGIWLKLRERRINRKKRKRNLVEKHQFIN